MFAKADEKKPEEKSEKKEDPKPTSEPQEPNIDSKETEKKEEPKPEEKKEESKTGLFSKPGSLFGAKTQGKLFSKSTSLFGKSNTGFGQGKSLFGGVSTFNSDSKSNAFISSGKKEEEAPAEPEKPTFIQVSKDPHIKLYKGAIEKFQLKTGSKGNGTISIEKSDPELVKDKKYAFLVF